MNITVIDQQGRISCRPDTTWEREDKDFFVPDQVQGFAFTPVLFARLSRAGKCIGGKFAQRYYESICFGVLLTAEDDPAGIFYDRTSVLPAATYSKHTLELPENEFSFLKDGRPVFNLQIGEGAMARVDMALADVSKVVSQRTGDIVALELAPSCHLVSRSDSGCRISGSWCGNQLFDFRIIF